MAAVSALMGFIKLALIPSASSAMKLARLVTKQLSSVKLVTRASR